MCRPAYKEELLAYLHAKKDLLCGDCKDRMEINPLRVLDCKLPTCQAELKDAPRMLDHLCDECKEHFASLQTFWTPRSCPILMDTGIVRGLDYYTKTVFEITTDNGTGTADRMRRRPLRRSCGRNRRPSHSRRRLWHGYGARADASGCDRTKRTARLKAIDQRPDVFIAPLDRSLATLAFRLLKEFRDFGLKADMNHTSRGLRAQFKYADKLGAAYVAILGERRSGERRGEAARHAQRRRMGNAA